MDIGKLLGDVEGGYHLGEEEAAALLKVRGRDMFRDPVDCRFTQGGAGRSGGNLRKEPEYPHHEYLQEPLRILRIRAEGRR